MYANRFEGNAGGRSIGMAAAFAINGGVVAALVFAGPTIVRSVTPTVLEATHIPIDEPPPPEPMPQPRAEPRPAPLPYSPTPAIDLPAPKTDTITLAPLDPPAPIPLDIGGGNATMPAAEPSPAAPVMTGAEIDPRHAGRFQPPYPAAERRAEISGRVTVRVRIGADGRVKAVERLSAASDGLFEATRRQALSAWRFRPATSDGVAIESWKVMTVRFELEG